MKSPTSPTTKTLGYWAYLAIEKHSKKIFKHEADVISDRDPEALHQMRVGMRRLRSAITGFAPALDLPKPAQEKRIGKIGKCLGTLRDLDVLKEALENHYKPALPSEEQKILETALEYLAKQRSKALQQVRQTLKNKDYKQLKQCLRKWLEQPTYRGIAELPTQEVLPDLLLPPVSHLLVHPAWLVGIHVEDSEIKSSKDLTHEAVEKLIAEHGLILHELRKETKRVRYQMELFTNFYSPTYTAFLEDVKSIQALLGQMQDSFVLAEFLIDALDSEKDKLPPTLAKQLAETRYQMWQQWQPLQLRYLNVHIRHSFRSELLLPTKEPTNGKAASAIKSANGVVTAPEV